VKQHRRALRRLSGLETKKEKKKERKTKTKTKPLPLAS
jgi:hypothetical protein